jgi:hypothetical protein
VQAHLRVLGGGHALCKCPHEKKFMLEWASSHDLKVLRSQVKALLNGGGNSSSSGGGGVRMNGAAAVYSDMNSSPVKTESYPQGSCASASPAVSAQTQTHGNGDVESEMKVKAEDVTTELGNPAADVPATANHAKLTSTSTDVPINDANADSSDK